MLNVVHSIIEAELLVDKDMKEAREQVRANMQRQFTFVSSTVDKDELPSNVRPISRDVKPYIPPTVPNDDDPYNPFGLREPPLR
jgi:hypothetical protein